MLNPQRMWADLTAVSGFANRYSKSELGRQASEWFMSQVKEMIVNSGRDDVSIFTVNTGSSYKQPSVVLKIDHSAQPAIVLGAHLDTTDGIKPGADDNGSGSVTVLEVARIFIIEWNAF